MVKNPIRRKKRKRFRRDWWGWKRRQHERNKVPHREVLFPLETRYVPLYPIDPDTFEISSEESGLWFTVPRSAYPILTSDIFPPKGEKGTRSKWNPFAHHQTNLSDFGFSGPGEGHVPIILDVYPGFLGTFFLRFDALSDANFASGFGDMGAWNKSLPSFTSGDNPSDEGWIPDPTNIDEMHHIALRRMLYGTNAELSLINSVIELKDFLSIGESVHKVVETAKLLIRDFLGKGSIFRGKTLRELFATAADGYLQLKFNFQPLVSDMQGVLTAWLRSTDRINAQILQNGRSRVKHYKFLFNEYEPRDDTDSYYSIIDASTHDGYGALLCPRDVRRVVEYEPTEVHCTVRYTARYSEFQLAHARGLALLDSLGVNFNPRTLWNAIPWSFVIDWFVSIGKWLNDFEVKWMKPTIHVQEYMWSVKRKRRIRVSFTTTFIAPPVFTGQLYHYPEVVETAYKRSKTNLDSRALETSGLSLTEFSLAAALAVSVGDRRRHRRVKHRLGPLKHKGSNSKKT